MAKENKASGSAAQETPTKKRWGVEDLLFLITKDLFQNFRDCQSANQYPIPANRDNSPGSVPYGT